MPLLTHQSFVFSKQQTLQKEEIQEVSTIKPNVMKYPTMSHILVNFKRFLADATKFFLPVIAPMKFLQERMRISDAQSCSVFSFPQELCVIRFITE